jgi:hypothetical protein
MARVDDYQESFDLAAEDAGYLQMSCLGRPVRVSAPPITVSAMDDGPELPLAEQALVPHYLAKAPLVGGEGPGTRSSRPRATCSLTATSAASSPPRTSLPPPGCSSTR